MNASVPREVQLNEAKPPVFRGVSGLYRACRGFLSIMSRFYARAGAATIARDFAAVPLFSLHSAKDS